MRSIQDNQERKNASVDTGHNFGTFYGVVLPSILTMLGAIMFLRVNYITGRAGILYSLIILAISLSIVMATALSISAISSNTASASYTLRSLSARMYRLCLTTRAGTLPR